VLAVVRARFEIARAELAAIVGHNGADLDQIIQALWAEQHLTTFYDREQPDKLIIRFSTPAHPKVSYSWTG
jgi:hypothetical protein